MILSFRFFPRFALLSALVASGLALTTARLAAADAAGDKQAKLIGVLQSGAPAAEKAITCKKLAVYGSKEAVPALAPLLTDPDLSSWARIALEAIPDPAAVDALRDTLPKVQGRLLVGVINSLGFRHDTQSVNALVARLADADPEVASAAAAALGIIGGETAARALQAALASAPVAVRAEVAEGCVRIAERFLAEGKAADAAQLYDAVRQANVPKYKVLEATRGAILARGAAGLPLLLEQLHSPDKAVFGIGLRTARELPGREVTEALAVEIDRTEANRQTLLFLALADRGDAAALPTIRKAAQTGSKRTRLAAIGALDRMASAASVPTLLEICAEDDAELSQAAKVALARLPGKEVNAGLVGRLPDATGKLRRVLLELAGQRQIAEVLPAAVVAAQDPDGGIRSAAIGAMGVLGDEKQAGDLVKLLEKTQDAKDRANIETALLSISGRRKAACLPVLLPLAVNSESGLREIALHTLASVGGPEALEAVKAALADKDEAVQDEAVRTLSTWPGNWPEDAAAAEPLLVLAKSGKKPSYQVLGLRGYLEYVQGDKRLGNDQKLAKIKDVLPLLKRPEEKRLAIAALSAAPSAGALELTLTFAFDSAVAEDAYLAVLNTASKTEAKDASKELRLKCLQTVADNSKVRRIKTRAEEAIKRIQ